MSDEKYNIEVELNKNKKKKQLTVSLRNKHTSIKSFLGTSIVGKKNRWVSK